MESTTRLAMIGMIPGNGHPYSWSAIINGYDPAAMALCPYPVIPQYLGARPLSEVRIPGARVTHIWTDDPADAPLVAAAAMIPNVVARPEDVIGEVDGVILSTDDGSDHARRARPFVEAGIPIFVDKPLATTSAELGQFAKWKTGGAKILSSSGMRYAPEVKELENKDWLWITSVTCKTWERYGIHALEPAFKLVGPGFEEVRSECSAGSDIVYCRHASGMQLTVSAIHEAYGSFGVLHAYGKDGERVIRMRDTYAAFRGQLLAATEWFRSGKDPYPFAETLELMAILIAARKSAEAGGSAVSVKGVLESVFP